MEKSEIMNARWVLNKTGLCMGLYTRRLEKELQQQINIILRLRAIRQIDRQSGSCQLTQQLSEWLTNWLTDWRAHYYSRSASFFLALQLTPIYLSLLSSASFQMSLFFFFFFFFFCHWRFLGEIKTVLPRLQCTTCKTHGLRRTATRQYNFF